MENRLLIEYSLKVKTAARRMARVLLGFAALSMLPVSAAAATYYIDYTGGSDANDGASKATPWKLAPGMQGFAGTYTHAPADQFIFKGGITWPNPAAGSPFPFVIDNSGSGDLALDY